MRRDLWLTMVGVQDLPRFAGRETLPRTARPPRPPGPVGGGDPCPAPQLAYKKRQNT
jgi:hypothetical protein